MKKLVLGAIALVAISTATYLGVFANQTSEYSDLAIASAEATAATESGSGKNYGPAEKEFCDDGKTKKLCLCHRGYPECTETDCF